jgi:hypothetical protein
MRSAPSLKPFLLFAACAFFGAGFTAEGAQAADPAAPYLGMTEIEITACAGEPHSRYKMGENIETLTYHYNGAGPVPAEGKPGQKEKKPSMADVLSPDKDKKKGQDWTCTASLKFEDGKLTSVVFAHRDVHSPYDWQKQSDPVKQEAMRKAGVPTCTFSLPNCHH